MGDDGWAKLYSSEGDRRTRVAFARLALPNE